MKLDRGVGGEQLQMVVLNKQRFVKFAGDHLFFVIGIERNFAKREKDFLGCNRCIVESNGEDDRTVLLGKAAIGQLEISF